MLLLIATLGGLLLMMGHHSRSESLFYFNRICPFSSLETVCKTPEEFKAWSQNLGHEKVLTTFASHGEVPCHRQGEIIRGLRKPEGSAQSDEDNLAKAFLKTLRDCGMGMQVRVAGSESGPPAV